MYTFLAAEIGTMAVLPWTNIFTQNIDEHDTNYKKPASRDDLSNSHYEHFRLN